MMKGIISVGLIIIIGVMLYTPCGAIIRTVSLDGTAQYTVIQQAINASANSDTVLVMPGRYYENISLNGKNITVASNEINTGNSAYIHSTIIDGNHAGSAVKIKNGELIVKIQGLTITNGSGDVLFGGRNYGGGVIISPPVSGKTVSIINCNVIDNEADDGAGIYAGASNLILAGTSIRNNTASDKGGGLYYYNDSMNTYFLTFDFDNRSSVYNNYSPTGTEMYFHESNNQMVVLDTCTVLNPWNFYICARPSNDEIINPFTFDILHSVHQEVNHDLYVAPWGDDNNSGIMASEPMKTIALAVYKIAAYSLNPRQSS